VTADPVWWVHDAHDPRWRRRAVAAFGVAGLEPDRWDAAALAVHEALCNARAHGHRGDDSRPIELRLVRSAEHRLAVHVVDQALDGPWSPPAFHGARETSSSVPVNDRGRGLRLMHAGCDELRILSSPGATRVVLHFDIRARPWERTGSNARFRGDHAPTSNHACFASLECP
jgi:anti-sigma regulatory factor (Ser/Thr protein kinase)